MGEGRAIILFRVRRAGKSYLAYGYLKRERPRPKETLILNFEDPRLSGIESRELTRIYEEYLKLTNAKRPIVVLDEVQSVEGWERSVRYLLEVKRTKMLVTGSSSKLMGEEYVTLLTGRHLSVEVLPLSFREFLRFKGFEIRSEAEALKERTRIRALLDEYLEYGGFPEVVLQSSRIVKEELLRTYFRDIVTIDVGFHTKVGLPITRNLGRIMENVVFLQLARKYEANEALFYYLTSDGREVDFVIKEGRDITELIQVTYYLREGDSKQFSREVGSLVRVSKELGCRKVILITMDQEDLIEEKGVEVRITSL